MVGERAKQSAVWGSHCLLPTENDVISALEHGLVAPKTLAHDALDPVPLDRAPGTLLGNRKTEPRGMLVIGPREHNEERVGGAKGPVKYPPVVSRPPEP
jgi:hypothetical protein